MEMRDYIAISIKHSTKDCIMYWGKRTPDNEDRCFSGYTPSFFDCERYTAEEFYKHYPEHIYHIVDDYKSYTDFMKKYKNNDTVLVKDYQWKDVIDSYEKRRGAARAKKGANVLHKGDKVVMHTCMEAKHYDGKIWECSTDSWDNYGVELVMLEGFSGGFWTKYLQKVNINN